MIDIKEEDQHININLVVSLLELTFRAGKDQDRISAELQLCKLSKKTSEMTHILLKIIGSEQYNDLIKESATNFLLKQLRTNKYFLPEMTSEFKDNFLISIMMTLRIETVSYKIKCHLKDCLTILLEDDGGSLLLKEKISQMLINAFKSNNIAEYLTGFIMIEVLLGGLKKISDVKKLFIDTIPFLTSIAGKLIILFNDYLKSYSSNDLILNKMSKEANIIYDALRSWLEIIKLFTTKFYETKSEPMELLFSNENLTQLFHEIISLTFNLGNQMPDCIFSTSGIEILDNSFNNLKKYVFSIYILMVSHSVRRCPSNLKYKNSVFLKYLQGQLPGLLISLIRIFKNGENIILGNEILKGSIQNALNLINVCIKNLELYTLFAQNKDKIITDLVFQCLKTTRDEVCLIDENPEEFFHQALDVCDKHISETFKSIAAKILESMNDHIDGSLTIIVHLALSSLYYSIESNNIIEINNKYQDLTKFVNIEFLTNTSPEIRIETSLMVLCILNYAICKRPDLIKEIEKIIIKHHDFFISSQISKLLRSRICLFLDYYLEDLFLSPEVSELHKEYFVKYLFHLANCLKSSQPTDLVIPLHALDAISHILENKEHLELMKKIINEIFPILISLTTSSQISQLFDLIQELLSNYFVFLNNKQDILNALLGSLRERIFAEMAKIKGTTNITNITINKSWNIIRTLSENKYFLPEYIEIMESHLYPLYEMLKDPTQIDFDEDILLLIATFIKKSKRITSLERGLYKFVGFYFDKYHNVFGNLFDTLNSYVFYGSDFLSNDKQCLDLTLHLGIKALFANNEYSNEANQSQGLLLIHLLLQQHSKILSDEQKNLIVTKTIERGCQTIRKDFLRCQLNEIFLSFFLFDFDFINKFLIKTGQYEGIIESILEVTQIYKHSYDKKIFIFGMATLLLQNVPPSILQKFPKILESLIKLLKFQQKIKKGNISMKRKEINQIFHDTHEERESNPSDNEEEKKSSMEDLEEDDADDNCYEDLEFDEDNEITTILNSFMTPVIIEDEYQYFKQTILRLKVEKTEMLKFLLFNMENKEKNDLNDILMCQKIVFDQAESKIFRKVVKVKNKNK